MPGAPLLGDAFAAPNRMGDEAQACERRLIALIEWAPSAQSVKELL
jgi:hypothetical protein